MNETVNADLARKWWVQADGDHLVDERVDLVRNVYALEVAATSAALARHTFRDGVEGEEQDGEVDIAHDLLERHEGVLLVLVQVVLVRISSASDLRLYVFGMPPCCPRAAVSCA